MFVKRLTAYTVYTATLVLILLPSSVQAITLEATTDVWIRESGPDATFEFDLMSVWNSFGNDPGTRRYGVVEFDVSSLDGVTVDFAFLRLWGDDFGFSDDSKDIKQSAVVIDTTGGTQASSMSWNIYQNEYAAGATPLENLGTLDVSGFADPAPARFYDSMGTAADRSLIETTAASGGGNQLLTLVMIGNESDGVEYAHSWGDGPDGLGGMNAELVINEVPPENADFVLEVNTASGATKIINPAILTPFDFDGYVIQSPNDPGSLDPVGWNSLQDQGEPGWTEVAPTSNALTELNLTSQTTLMPSQSLNLGAAFAVGGIEDLTFQYNLAGGSPLSGRVEYVTGGPACDFDGMNGCNIDDIDALVAESAAGTNDPAFDLTGDGLVDLNDITDPDDGWLRQAGEENLGPGQSYLGADSTLDGTVDGQDFLAWNTNKFTDGALWSGGDWNADGTSDGPDFLIWNTLKFMSSDGASAVPEPASAPLWLLMAWLSCLVARHRRN